MSIPGTISSSLPQPPTASGAAPKYAIAKPTNTPSTASTRMTQVRVEVDPAGAGVGGMVFLAAGCHAGPCPLISTSARLNRTGRSSWS